MRKEFWAKQHKIEVDNVGSHRANRHKHLLILLSAKCSLVFPITGEQSSSSSRPTFAGFKALPLENTKCQVQSDWWGSEIYLLATKYRY